MMHVLFVFASPCRAASGGGQPVCVLEKPAMHDLFRSDCLTFLFFSPERLLQLRLPGNQIIYL